MPGYFAVSRDIFDHPIVGRDGDRLRVWLWLVAQARFKPGRFETNTGTVKLKRGEFGTSLRRLADEVGWSRSKMDRFLTRLKTGTGDGPMIEVDTGTGQMIITICNYEKYQSMLRDGGTVSEGDTGTASGTEAGQQRDTKEECKEALPSEVRTTRARAHARESPTEVLAPLLGKELAKDLVEHRQRVGKPMTKRAAELIRDKLKAFGDPALGAETMIEKGWQGFEPHWMDRINRGKGKSNGRADKIFRMADDLDRRAEAERDVDRGEGDGPAQPLLPTGD